MQGILNILHIELYAQYIYKNLNYPGIYKFMYAYKFHV